MNDYLSPDRVCDLIMKGGITSGVVYPPAIDEMARRFYLSGVGGASAGAIAAALAAAAEYRRRNGSGEGFEMLAELPQEVAGPGRMVSLFRPDQSTKPLFNLFLDALRLKENNGFFKRWGLYARAAWAVKVGGALKKLTENGQGMCTGMGLGNSSEKDLMPPLTEWLSERIDSIAGLDRAGGERRPLTFGDLWRAPKPAKFAETMGNGAGIKLQLVSTCLTFGRPYSMPNLDRRFAFNPDELRRLFPKYVVDYMVKEGTRIEAERVARIPAGKKDDNPPPPAPLVRLPVEASMPVIVAVRMSLSFPVLFSLVPFYYPNYHAKEKAYEKVYFADGGITSNLPMHYFDSPFPRWPTFAINLQYNQTPGAYGRSGVDENGIWMAKNNATGVLELFYRFLTGDKPVGQLMGLAGAIFRSAQVWSDNSFLQLPGYRDRVAELWLEPHEGGMNLEMPQAVIESLVGKGRAIGKRFVQRFAEAAPTEKMSWDGHRWVRYRSGMAALAQYVRAWRASVEHPMPGDRPLWEMLASTKAAPSYEFKGENGETAEMRRAAAESATRALMGFASQLDGEPVCRLGDDDATRPFCDGPRPEVCLQARAPDVRGMVAEE